MEDEEYEELVPEDDDVEVEEAVEDKYREATSRNLGLRGPLLSASEGNNGGLLGFSTLAIRDGTLRFGVVVFTAAIVHNFHISFSFFLS